MITTIDFIKKYTVYDTLSNKHWKYDFNSLLEQCKKDKTLTLCFHTLLEEQYPYKLLMNILEYDEKSKKEIFEDENTFKWACAWGDNELITYLIDKVSFHNISSAITASINQNNLKNILTLQSFGYENEIFTEQMFLHALSRSQQSGAILHIVDFYFENLDKFKQLSPYFYNQLPQLDLIYKAINDDYENIYEFLFNWEETSNQKQIERAFSNIVTESWSGNKIHIIDTIMKSNTRDGFIKYFNKNKTQLIIDNLDLETKEGDYSFHHLLSNHSELLKPTDFKLWMTTTRSKKLNTFIEKHRTIPESEIKKSFITLSKDFPSFLVLYNQYLDFDYGAIKIGKSVNILNNIEEQTRMTPDIHNNDSVYMQICKNVIYNHPDFIPYEDSIRSVINDQSMINILYKQKLKETLSKELPNEKQIKKSLKL